MARVKYFRTKVWNQEAKFKTIEEARKHVMNILDIYSNSGINAAMIRWEITPIYK